MNRSGIDVEIWDASLLGHADWRELRDQGATGSDTTVNDYKRFLAEAHHQLYGRPWCIGRTYFEFLLQSGLLPSHRVLDFGCGAGRIGIWLIPYLEAAHYVGVDHHWIALDAFARYEVPLHDLAGKSPRLVLDGSLSVARLADSFDVILDCYVSFHLGEADRLRLYRGFRDALRPGGRVFLPHAATLTDSQLSDLGLALVDERVMPSPFLVGHLPERNASDHWHVVQRTMG